MSHARQILTLLGSQTFGHSSSCLFSSTARLSSRETARNWLESAGPHTQNKRQRLKKQANCWLPSSRYCLNQACGATMAAQKPGTEQQIASGNTVIAYHFPCPDGIFAALAAHLHFQQRGHTNVRFAPNRVFAPCTIEELQLQASDTLFLLDYVGPPGFAVKAANHAGRVVVLDHHKTAAEALGGSAPLPGTLDVHLDMERSGATISLDYFQPQITEVVRQLFSYIEDADLWRWALKDSKAFHAGFGTLGLYMDANKNPDIFQKLLSLDPASVIAKGKAVEAELDRRIAEAVSGAFVLDLGGARGAGEGWGQCMAVRADPPSTLSSIRSQLGNALANEAQRRGLRAVGAVAYIEPDMNDSSKVKCSLRSTGEEDTTVISSAYGGGGHKNASSFILNAAEFESWRA